MALGAAAAPKANELLTQVETTARSAVLDELALRRIAAEARQLMPSDAPWAHLLLGTIGAVRGDLAATRDHYRIALDLGSEVAIWVNYTTSLTLLDENQAAMNVARQGLRVHPNDPALLRQTVQAALMSGCIEEAVEVCRRHDKLLPDHPHRMGHVTRRLSAAVAAGPMSEAGVQKLIEQMTAIQREEGVRTLSAGIGFRDDTFLCDRGVRCTPAIASSMNWRLAGAVVERADLSADPGRLMVGGFVGVVDGSNA